jgi:hypothetical protein
MSFHEISVVIRAVNRASSEFGRVSSDAETMAERVRTAGTIIAGLGAASRAVAVLGHQFGFLTTEQERWLASMSYVVTALGIFLRSSWGVAVAQKVYAVATTIAANVTWAFNAALAMKIALLTLGVGLVVAAAAYMAWLASTTRDAASAQEEYNTALSRQERVGRSRGEEVEYERITRRGAYY